MNDTSRSKALLRLRAAAVAQYLFPNGHREGNHWCVGSIEGARRERSLHFEIALLRCVRAPFEFVFWLISQWLAKAEDELERIRS
jgi:hypothetical protein